LAKQELCHIAERFLDMGTVELHTSIALEDPEIRKTAAAYERLFSAVRLLDKLPYNLLEVLQHHVAEEYRYKQGPLADFVNAYIGYLKEETEAKKKRDRRLRFGIGLIEDSQSQPGPKKDDKQ